MKPQVVDFTEQNCDKPFDSSSHIVRGQRIELAQSLKGRGRHPGGGNAEPGKS